MNRRERQAWPNLWRVTKVDGRWWIERCNNRIRLYWWVVEVFDNHEIAMREADRLARHSVRQRDYALAQGR